MEDELVYEIVDDTLIVKSGNKIPELSFFKNPIKKVILNEGLVIIGSCAFIRNGIVEIEMPSSVEEIGKFAFNANSDLKRVKLNEGLEVIGPYAFYGCGLSEIEIPSSVKVIGTNAFEANLDLEKVIFNEGLLHISHSSFRYCSLKEVEIPFSVRKIESGVFKNNSLEKVYLYEGSPISKLDRSELKDIFDDAEIIIRPVFKIPSEEEFNVKAVSDDERLRLGRELFELVSGNSYTESRKDLDKVKELLLNGADTELVDEKGNTGLMISIEKNFVNTFKLYMLSKCDINHKNRLGNNPLILCSKYNRNELASILIDNDCIINGINRLDEDALSIARINNNSYLVDTLERLLDIEKKYNMNNLDDRLRRVLSK